MVEIKVYGQIISQHAKDGGEKGFTLSDLQNQLAKANGEPVKVRFNSPGGDVQEGFALYDELRRYAATHQVQVHTYAESYLASIVTVPFLAGDVREISRTIEPFVHNAWTNVEGDSRDFTAVAAELEKCNDKIARHYAEHTDLTYDEARELMNANTSITAKEALKMRFATKIESIYRPVALQRFNTNNNKMSKNNKGILAKIKAIFDGVQNKIVKDAEQRDVDFYELEEDEAVEVGANATIGGAPAEGELVMADGQTYVFAAGVLTEIRPAESAAVADDEPTDLDAANARIAELEGQLATTQAQLEEKTILAKDRLKAINNFRKLESEFVEDEPAPAPRNQTRKTETKGAKAGAAISGYLNAKPKQK